MRNLFFGVLAMTLLAINPTFAAGDNADVSAIKTVMESMATMGDRNEYEALEKIFDDELEVDYTSLSGGEVEVKSNTALMTAWAGLLPGFERTRHTLTDLKVQLHGDIATGSSKITAEHWVDGLFWSVSGTYDYSFRKDNGQWRITKLKLNFEKENGTRDVFAIAMQHAANNPVAYVVRQKNRQLVLEFLTTLAEKDKTRFGALWAEDAVQDIPFTDKPNLRRIAGKANILRAYENWFTAKDLAKPFTALVLRPMQNPEEFSVEFNSKTDLFNAEHSGKHKFAGLFHILNGKVTFLRIYSGSPTVQVALD